MPGKGRAYGHAKKAAAVAKKPTPKAKPAPRAKPSNHGQAVSAVAKNKTGTGKEHGAAVSAVAKSNTGKGKTK
jgi:hypothetical protein